MMTRFFRAIPPSAMTLLTGILLGEALHNGASAEGGGGDQTAEQRRRVGAVLRSVITLSGAGWHSACGGR